MAEPRKLTDDITVNDGRGLFDSEGLIDTLIEDCNELVGFLVSGRYVAVCSRIVGMVQKLGALKTGVRDNIEARDEQIKELTELLNGGDADGVGG